jgi:hypothetical protein
MQYRNYQHKKVKQSLLQAFVSQRVGRSIALLFLDRGTRRGWVVSSTPRPHFTPGKDPVPILQEAGWAPAPVWTGGKSRPHRDSIPDRPARSQSLYRLSYPAHGIINILTQNLVVIILTKIFPQISKEMRDLYDKNKILWNRNGQWNICKMKK